MRFEPTKPVALSGVQKTALFCVISGAPGAGKTTLAAHYRPKDPGTNNLVLSFEQNDHHINADKKVFSGYQQILQELDRLCSGPQKYPLIVLDGLESLVEHLKEGVPNKTGSSYERSTFGKGDVALISIIHEIVGKLQKLRREKGVHIFITTQSAVRSINLPDCDQYDSYVTLLPCKLANKFISQSDIYGLLRRKVIPGKPPRLTLQVDTTPSFCGKNTYRLPHIIDVTNGFSAVAKYIGDFYEKNIQK